MAGVRAKKSRRKKTIKITKNARKKKKIIKPALGNAVLKEHWDKRKTLQQNLKDLGLAYNPNDVVKIAKQKKLKQKEIIRQSEEGEDVMEVEAKPVNNVVIEEFEKTASNGKKIERHISPGEAKFLMKLIQKHGTNYKAMCKDKQNTYQHTPKQLRRKCEGLLKSSLYQKYKEMFPELASSSEMDAMCKDKQNTYQHTPKQLRRKCEGLLKSSLYQKYKEMFPELASSSEMDVS